MFVEVLPNSRAKHILPAKIEPPLPENYELRLVIWETRNVFSDIKTSLDLFLKVMYNPEGWLGKPIVKETDTHLGCEDGKAVYNWRMKFDIKIPCSFPRLYFTLHEFNSLSQDQAIGESYISLRRVLKRLIREGKLALEDKWIPLTHPKDPGDIKGEVKISLYLLQKDEANQRPVGEAQDEPNRDPRLEKPKEGRGVKDFLKNTVLDVKKWDIGADFMKNIKIIIALAVIVIVFILLFVSPGWLRG